MRARAVVFCGCKHDHAGNVTAQIAYTTNAQNILLPRGRGLPAKRWNFPDYFYNVTQHVEIPGAGGKMVELELLLFDSCIMAGNPADPGTAEAQLAWLGERMANSTADYLWVGGHYPVWAIGNDPPTGVNPILRPLLHKWEANYFNGHEHDLEHIREEGSKVNYISTGAGHFCCYPDTNLGTVPQGSIRFATSGRGGMDWWGRRPVDFELLSGFVSVPGPCLASLAPPSPSPAAAAAAAACACPASLSPLGTELVPARVLTACRPCGDRVPTVPHADLVPDRPGLDERLLPRAQRHAALHHPAHSASHQGATAARAAARAALLERHLPRELHPPRAAALAAFSPARARAVPALAALAARPDTRGDGLGVPPWHAGGRPRRGKAKGR